LAFDRTHLVLDPSVTVSPAHDLEDRVGDFLVADIHLHIDLRRALLQRSPARSDLERRVLSR